MEKDYGATGGALAAMWKRELDEIVKDVKFGGVDENTAFDGLKVKINDAVNKYIEKGKRWKMIFWIALVVTIPLVLLFGSTEGAGAWVVIVGGCACVGSHFAKKGCYKVLEAAYDFDEAYFGGEIFYRRKNG